MLRAISDVPPKDAIKEAMKVRKSKETVTLVKQLLKNKIKYIKIDEESVLERDKKYIEKVFNAEVVINSDYDPKNKRKFAIPMKPAIYVE